VKLNRRSFLKLLIAFPIVLKSDEFANLKGDVTLLFTSDLHSQLIPVYSPEPASVIVPENLKGLPGTFAGKEFLKIYKIPEGSKEAYLFSCVDFEVLAYRYGKTGGGEYITKLAKEIRNQYPEGSTLLLDGGDALMTGAFGLLTQGKAVAEWMKLTGYDFMVGHWEFSLPRRVLLRRLKELSEGGCEFISHNVYEEEDVPFTESRLFKPYAVRDLRGIKIGIVGSSYPFMERTMPKRLLGNWSFGIRESSLRECVKNLREKEKVDIVVFLSHNGILPDIELAKRVEGIDLIISAHSHDALPGIYRVPGTETLVVCGGYQGKFLGMVELKLSKRGIKEIFYTLYPILPSEMEADEEAKSLISNYIKEFNEKGVWERLGTAETLLFRRDPFFSTWDWLMGEAVKEFCGGELDLFISPGFRWGNTILPGMPITKYDILSCTGITFPEVYLLKVRGEHIKLFLENSLEEFLNPDPLLHGGRDMPRFWNLEYEVEVNAPYMRKIKEIKIGGKKLNPRREYLVAVFGGIRLPFLEFVDNLGGKPIYDILSEYIKKKGSVKVREEPNVRVVDERYIPFNRCAGGIE